MVRKMQNLVSRQAQAAASKETVNTQPSSDDAIRTKFIVCSPRSSPRTVDVPVTVVTNKGCQRKTQVSESEGDEVPATTATEKVVKAEDKIPKFNTSQNPSN